TAAMPKGIARRINPTGRGRRAAAGGVARVPANRRASGNVARREIAATNRGTNANVRKVVKEASARTQISAYSAHEPRKIIRVVDRDDHLARFHLGIRERLGRIVHRPDADVFVLEELEPLVSRLRAQDLLDLALGGSRLLVDGVLEASRAMREPSEVFAIDRFA